MVLEKLRGMRRTILYLCASDRPSVYFQGPGMGLSSFALVSPGTEVWKRDPGPFGN